jgi:hypothetical protein
MVAGQIQKQLVVAILVSLIHRDIVKTYSYTTI